MVACYGGFWCWGWLHFPNYQKPRFPCALRCSCSQKSLRFQAIVKGAPAAAPKPDCMVLLPVGPSREVAGYEIGAPGRFAPLLVYRRLVMLEESELGLGVPDGQRRRKGPLPPCE